MNDFINLPGLLMALLLFLPDFLGGPRRVLKGFLPVASAACRVAGFALMAFNLGVLEWAPSSFFEELSYQLFYFWVAVCGVLSVVVFVLFLCYRKKPARSLAGAMTAITAVVIVLSGLLLGHWLTLACGVLFALFRILGVLFARQQPENAPTDAENHENHTKES